MIPDLALEPRRINQGRSGLIYALSSQVVVKVDRLPRRSHEGEPGIRDEQAHYMRLIRGSASEQILCPYIVPVFCHAPAVGTFMLRSSRDLRSVLFQRDRSDGTKGYCHDPVRTARWMGQLCGAVAFLVEKHQLVHGDLRPDNVLVDDGGNLRLTDLASAVPVGAWLPVAGEPWGRMLGAPDGVPPEDRSYGRAGARTESFALGSFYYSLLRGHYPCAREQYGFVEMIVKFQNKEFPALDPAATPGDAIIARCWDGAYADDATSISALEREFRGMGDGTEWYQFALEDPEWFAETRQACQAWTEGGHFKSLLAGRNF